MRTRFLLAGALATALTAGAVPAKRGVQTVVQPDGTTIQVRSYGDEFMHFLTTEDGYLLTRDDKGFLSYGNIDNDGVLKTTGIVARNTDNPSTFAPGKLQNISSVKAPELMELRAKKALVSGKRKSVPQSGMGRFTSDFPRSGDIKALVILVEYADVSFRLSDPKTYFTDLLNKDGFSEYGGTGCAAEYFRESSMDQFRPQFDVFGPVVLPEKMKYYGGNNYYGDDENPEMMLVHAADILDDEIDFSQYDMDGDGYVDNVYIFYAGLGEATSFGAEDTVWPHSWNVSYGQPYQDFIHDGVKIDRYACSNEWESGRPDGIGTFVHEFSHVMGLPDLYTTDYGSASRATPGSWSVLDYGPYNNDGRTPPIYSVFERNAMGWIEPKVLLDPEEVTLGYIGETNDGAIIQTNNKNEFFLFENRQKVGWDKYLPGHGMLIWHIDFNQRIFDSNTVNNQLSHQYVDIEEANGRADNTNNSAMAGYAWPGTSKKTEFTGSTTPALKMWNGTVIDVPITEITEKDGLISFKVSGGKPLIGAPSVDNNSVEAGADYFYAVWGEVEGATDYLLTVKAVDGENVIESITADMGSDMSVATFPEGWTSSTTGTYTTESNYGESKPALKFNNKGANLTTAEYDAEINGISFWAKGQQTNGSYLTIEGLVEGEWKKIEDYTPLKNEAETHQVKDIPAGVKQVKFTYNKATGNLALDDLVLTFGITSKVLPDYNNVSTNGETSVKVDKLLEGYRNYAYNVVATDGENISKPSETVFVTISTSGIEGVGDNGKASVSVNGAAVTVKGLKDNTNVAIYDVAGRIVNSAESLNGQAVLRVASTGIYVVKAGELTFKIAVR